MSSGCKPKPVGDDLRQHRLVALALHGDVGGDRHRAERIDVDGHHRGRAVLRSGLVARLRRQQGREIAHVRHGGLDHDGEADAVFPAGLARVVAALLQIVEPAVADRDLHRARIVAGVVKRAGRGLVGKFLGRHEIAPDHVEMIELELDRDALHQPLQRQIELRAAEAANEARRHLVGQHHAVDDVDIGNVVAAGHRAMHAVERPRHRRAQERAVVLELIHLQPEDFAVLRHGSFDLGDAVRAGAGGEQMLGAVLDPFHRAAGDLRRERGQHHIRKHRELDAEAAAGVRRNAKPHLRAGHAQRPRHHRMRAERSLEVRHAVVAVVGRIVRGDDDETLHRRERQPVEVHRQLDDLVGLLERALGVAVVKLADRNLVGLRFGMQDRRTFLARSQRIDHRLKRGVFDVHQLGRILGEIAAFGDHQRDRLADEAHPIDRERPLMDRRLQRDQERIGNLFDIGAGDDGPDAVLRQRFGRCRC